MGKSLKRKIKQVEANTPDYCSIFLQSKVKQIKKHNDIVSFDPLVAIEGYQEFAIKPLKDFVSRTRSLNITIRVNELIRYAFNKYNPPSFLYQVWEPGFKSDFNTFPHIKENYKFWFLALAQGKSLYKECAMGLLTKMETHYFSTCPYNFTIPEAIWYSIILGIDNKSFSLAKKIASTKISREPITNFWKDVARWFMNNSTSIRQMNDLIDYIRVRHRANDEWYLSKDITLHNLIKNMNRWHRETYRVGRMSHFFPKWEGIKVGDSIIERGAGKKRVQWKFHQITTGKELAEEGSRMHHCVSSYGQQCSTGVCSIWSLKQRDVAHNELRSLTIEVRNNAVVQARGYANRTAKKDELSVLGEWAVKNNFTIHGT